LPGGLVKNAGTVQVGDTRTGAWYMLSSNNFVRVNGGGEVNCAALNIIPGNYVEFVVGKDGTGKIAVGGAVTFGADTHIRVSAEEGAPAGNYEIIPYGSLTGAGLNPEGIPVLKTAESDKNTWKVYTKNNAVWLRFSYPMTVIVVR